MTDGDGKGGDKGGGKGKPKAPKVPKDAPKEVKDFLSCKRDSVELDAAKKDWVPDLPLVGKPNVKIEAGAKAGATKVTLSKGGDTIGVKYEFEVSVKDGHLEVDTSKVGTEMVKDGIDGWVKGYNDWLDAKGRKLEGITVKDGKATIKKAAKPAGQAGAGAGVKKAALVGAMTVALVGGGYVAYQAADDGGGSGGTPTAGAAGDGESPAETVGNVPDEGFDGQISGVGVAISHDGSAPDAATGDTGPSQADVVAVTDTPGLFELVLGCNGETSTAEAEPDADGVLHFLEPLREFGHCDYTSLVFMPSGGGEVELPELPGLDWQSGFDVGPEPTEVTDPQIAAALEAIGLDASAYQAETVESFLAQLADSLSSDDPQFAVDRLHPTVLSAFPTQCPAHLASVTDPAFAIDVTQIGAAGTYVYAPPSLGGEQYTVADVLAIAALVTSEGATAPQELHVAEVDGEFHWFTDCG